MGFGDKNVEEIHSGTGI